MKAFKRLNALIVLVIMLAMAVPAITFAGAVEGIDAPPPGPETEVTSTLEEIGDGYVVVDGNHIFIGTGAEVEGPLSVGDVVEVHVRVNNSGDLVAREIEAVDDGFDDEDNSNDNDDDDGANGNNNDNDDDDDDD